MTLNICLITYNHEKYISQSIDSVLMQKTNFDFDIIIGEDDSSDSTRKICQNYMDRPNIQLLLNESNLGMMANFINTLKHCKGKYVAICEGDDYWIDEYKLQKQVDYLDKNNDCSMVITNRFIENEKGQKLKDTYFTKNKYELEDIIRGFVPPTQTIVFRNNPLLASFLSRFPKDASGGDRFLGYFCSFFGYIYLLEDVTAVYRITGQGFWTSESHFNKLVSAYNYYRKFHKAIGIPIDNIYVNQYAFDVIINILFYTIKRPWLLFKNAFIIFRLYKELSWSNHLILFSKALISKFKSLLKK